MLLFTHLITLIIETHQLTHSLVCLCKLIINDLENTNKFLLLKATIGSDREKQTPRVKKWKNEMEEMLTLMMMRVEDNNNNSIKIESGLEVIKLFTSLTIALIRFY